MCIRDSLYEVTKLNGDDVYVRHESDNEIKLSYAQVACLLRLSYARTYASCQGTEFEETLRLHDCGNRHFTMRHLFVALSRAKDAKKIDIAGAAPQAEKVLYCTKHFKGPLDVWYDCEECVQGSKEDALQYVRWISQNEVSCLNKKCRRSQSS